MTSEISWNNQSSSISSSSTSSTSFNDYYYYDRSHHLHYLFRYPYKQKLQSTQETEVKQFQHKDDVRIKLESELCQKVREAVKTPPRERLIRRRLNEFQYEVRKRLEGEKQKKHLATQMNEVITLGLISGIHSVDNPLNMNKEVGIMDLRLHPESYQQNLGWYKQSDTKVNSQRIQWNKKNIFTEGKFKKIKFLLIDQKECKSGSDSTEATSIDTHEGSLKNLNKMITFRDTFNRNDPLLCLNTTPDIVKGYYHSNIDQVNTHNDNNQRMNISSLRSCSHTIWNRLEEIKKPSVYIKQPLNNSMDTITSLIRFQHDNEYKLILNDTFTFNWNTIIYNDNSINQSTNEYLHQYLCNYNLLADYLSYEDVQLLNKYSKLYQSKLLLDKKSNRSKQCHIVTRQSVLEQFGRLTDDEKQLFYFSATRAAYLMGSSEPQHKLPDGTQYRLVNQSEIQPLDSIIINNLFIDPINQFHSETGNVKKLTNHCINIPNNTTNTSRQAKNSVYTLPTFIDWSAVVRDRHGPFWPQGYGPICQILHNVHAEEKGKHINNNNKSSLPDYTEELNQLRGRQTLFKGIQVVYDSETSPYLLQSQDSSSSSSSSGSVNMHQLIKDTEDINQWSPPCLIFESRFESGNLRQVRRIGPFHYELLLKPDLYTKRHVQWYFFCIRNTLPGFTYTFLIINFTKPTSLYSQGLQPLLYSKINTQQNGKKWIRIGKNIKYTRNTTNLTNHLLDTSGEYYQLEWDMIDLLKRSITSPGY
ncbi:unnamed protein product [Heterobilharzia americana]|nr:unnamed protein product [Heterobilharzia americana]